MVEQHGGPPRQCPKCGGLTVSEASFCPYCGTRLVAASIASQQTHPTEMPMPMPMPPPPESGERSQTASASADDWGEWQDDGDLPAPTSQTEPSPAEPAVPTPQAWAQTPPSPAPVASRNPAGWRCQWCGAENAADADHCEGCGASAPHPEQDAAISHAAEERIRAATQSIETLRSRRGLGRFF